MERLTRENRPSGVIFDVDETMLDNYVPAERTSIHDLSGRATYKAIGEKYGYDYMINLTTEENTDAFRAASTHSAEGGAWEILRRAGVVTGEMDPLHPLIHEIIEMKDIMHGALIEKYGRPIRGADTFVRALGAVGLTRKLAIASTAARGHINIFLGKTHLESYFPNNHIFSKESVAHYKPDPEVFEKAFQSLRLPDEYRGRTLAFDDAPYGIVAAKKVGLFVCGITTSYSEDELAALPTPPDIIVDNYQQFVENYQDVAKTFNFSASMAA